MTIDDKALNLITYGLYIVTSSAGEKKNGMIANSFFQITAEPARAALSVNKKSLTWEYITKTKTCAVMPVTESADMPFIGNFGFRTGRNFDKFAKVKYSVFPSGLPVVEENTSAAYELKIDQEIDEGTHTLFVGEITAARIITPDKACMTYGYYHNTLKGKTPEGATHK